MPISPRELLGTKVLLATDGSEGAELATRAAVEVSDGTSSELHVVYVEPLPNFMKNGHGTPGYDRELYEMIQEGARETLRKLTWRVKVAGGTLAEAHLRMGGVAEEIVGLADELEAGLVVVGSCGRGRIRRTLAGSVSESVFRHARCPVLRVTYAILTEEGREALERALPTFRQEIEARSAGHLTEEEIRTIRQAMRKVIRASGEEPLSEGAND